MSVKPATQPQERRTDSARREAYDQRDRSKRLGLAVNEPKAAAKMSAGESGAARMI